MSVWVCTTSSSTTLACADQSLRTRHRCNGISSTFPTEWPVVRDITAKATNLSKWMACRWKFRHAKHRLEPKYSNDYLSASENCVLVFHPKSNSGNKSNFYKKHIEAHTQSSQPSVAWMVWRRVSDFDSKLTKILPKINSKMHQFFDRFFHPFFFDFRSSFFQKSTKILPKTHSKMHYIFDRFFHRFFFDFDSMLEANLGRLGASWGRLGPSWAVLAASWELLGPSWRPLGASWRPRPTRDEGELFFWRPLGTVLTSFFEGFWIIFMNFLYLSYLILQDVNIS